MEINLSKVVQNINTKEEKINLVEQIRFILIADDIDFQNYFDDNKLSECDFNSVFDLLYQLDNYYMFADFLKRHGEEVKEEQLEISNLVESVENFDEDIFFTRLSSIPQLTPLLNCWEAYK